MSWKICNTNNTSNCQLSKFTMVPVFRWRLLSYKKKGSKTTNHSQLARPFELHVKQTPVSLASDWLVSFLFQTRCLAVWIDPINSNQHRFPHDISLTYHSYPFFAWLLIFWNVAISHNRLQIATFRIIHHNRIIQAKLQNSRKEQGNLHFLLKFYDNLSVVSRNHQTSPWAFDQWNRRSMRSFARRERGTSIQ